MVSAAAAWRRCTAACASARRAATASALLCPPSSSSMSLSSGELSAAGWACSWWACCACCGCCSTFAGCSHGRGPSGAGGLSSRMARPVGGDQGDKGGDCFAVHCKAFPVAPQYVAFRRPSRTCCQVVVEALDAGQHVGAGAAAAGGGGAQALRGAPPVALVHGQTASHTLQFHPRGRLERREAGVASLHAPALTEVLLVSGHSEESLSIGAIAGRLWSSRERAGVSEMARALPIKGGSCL